MSDLRLEESGPLNPGSWLADPRRRVAFDCAALVGLVVTVLVCVVPALAPARTGVLLLGFCLVPGCAALTRLDVDGLAEATTLAIVLGFSLLSIGSLVMVWAGWWHPDVLGVVVGGASAGFLLADLASAARRAWR